MEITGIGEAQRRRRIKTYLWDIGEYEEAGGDEAEDEENIIPVLDEGIEDALSYIWPGDWRTSWHSFPRLETDQDEQTP